mmetsp:Transcript_16443/g.20093  ORF Transcript_16443/g.20093 Transcript_16443/m.20093 type:complete len:113 (+) Transcript_16443:913-1251(+)
MRLHNDVTPVNDPNNKLEDMDITTYTSNFSALVQCSSQSYRSFECKNQIIDTDTNLIEAFPIVRKTSDNVAMKVENTWSSRYLRPYRCIHDNRPEFIGQPIKQMLQRHDCHL